MTEPRTTLRARRVGGADGAPRLKFGHKAGMVDPTLWRWFQGEQGYVMAPALQLEDLPRFYALFLQQTADPPDPEDVGHWPELAEMLAAHRAEQATQKAAAPRKPRGRTRTPPAA